jgi:glycosyltransferase involved in cell wall biosynthesis
MIDPAAPPAPALAERAGLPDAERVLGARFRARDAGYVEELVVHRAVADPRVTLVVVSYKAKEYLLDCLRHLKGQTVRGSIPYEILLADSGGLEPLRDRTPDLVDVDLRLTSGLPLNVARNAAMAWARGELVAFIDDDGLVVPDWLEQALAVMADPSIALARGRIVPHKHPWLTLHAGHYDRGDTLWDDDSLATEGNMIARRGVYLEIDGFPDQFYGSEGTHLVFQLKRAFPSRRAVYAPGMVMRHDYCRSVREFVWKARRYSSTDVEVTRDDPDFAAFLEAYRRRPKPTPTRTFAQRLARKAMRYSERLIARMPLFDRVSRR